MTSDRPGPADRLDPRPDDRPAVLAAVLGFSLALGVATVAVPLVALAAGYDPATVGLLVAVAAGMQLATRLALPWILGSFPDRALMAVASLGLAAMFTLLLASTALPVFLLAQVLQGASRAVFWTSSMTHMVRGPGPSIRRLVDLNVAGNLGTLSGPAIAGTLAVVSVPLALGSAVVAALLGAVLALRLERFEPFDRGRSAGTIGLLQRPGVDVACWAGIVAGGWFAMLGSFIPVLLVDAGFGSAGVGWLITISEGSGMIALLLLRRTSGRARVRRTVLTGVVVIAFALTAMALVPASVVLYAVLLIVGGAASGMVTTLGPALASLAAGPDEQGDALALTGTFRAAALLAAPALVGLLLGVVALGPALVALAGSMLAPGIVIGARSRSAEVRRAAGSGRR